MDKESLTTRVRNGKICRSDLTILFLVADKVVTDYKNTISIRLALADNQIRISIFRQLGARATELVKGKTSPQGLGLHILNT